MTAEDHDKRFATLIRALAETFNSKLTDAQLMGYAMGLEGISLDDLEYGVRRAMRGLKFMPKPVELRELCGEMSLATRAAMAWGAAKKAVHALSAYRSPDFDDPVINAVIRNMGGWVDFCGRDADTFETFTRRDFERIYQSLASFGVNSEMGAPLKGIHGEGPTRFLVGYTTTPERKRMGPSLETELLGGITGVVIDRRAKQ